MQHSDAIIICYYFMLFPLNTRVRTLKYMRKADSAYPKTPGFYHIRSKTKNVNHRHVKMVYNHSNIMIIFKLG